MILSEYPSYHISCEAAQWLTGAAAQSGEPPRPRNWFLYFRNTRPTSNFQSRLIVLRCEEQWEAIWDTMANNWNIKNIYIANDIIWHDENAGMERKVEIKKIFDIYIKILYLPHRAEGSQAVVRRCPWSSHEMASANIERPRQLAPGNCVFHSDIWSPHFIGDPGHEALATGQQHSHSITCPITSLGPSSYWSFKRRSTQMFVITDNCLWLYYDPSLMTYDLCVAIPI